MNDWPGFRIIQSDIPPLGDEFFSQAKRPFRGEEWLSALLLAMLLEH
jgi:hypothetical protein